MAKWEKKMRVCLVSALLLAKWRRWGVGYKARSQMGQRAGSTWPAYFVGLARFKNGPLNGAYFIDGRRRSIEIRYFKI